MIIFSLSVLRALVRCTIPLNDVCHLGEAVIFAFLMLLCDYALYY